MLNIHITKRILPGKFLYSYIPRYLTSQIGSHVTIETPLSSSETATLPVEDAEVIDFMATPMDRNKLRLSQVIANAGLTSRRESERIINEKRVTIDGKLCNLPSMLISPEAHHTIEIDGIPLQSQYQAMPKLWAVMKQSREIMSTSDHQKSRSLLVDRMKNMIMPQVYAQYEDQLRPIYRLDYIIEGLALYTNSGELAKLIHQKNVSMTYRIRINGLITDSKLIGLTKGLHQKEKSFLPMTIEIENQSNTMTWMKVTTTEKQFHRINDAFKSVYLNITRGICIGYGHYLLKDLFPPDSLVSFTEVKLTPALHAEYMKLQNMKYSHHRVPTTTIAKAKSPTTSTNATANGSQSNPKTSTLKINTHNAARNAIHNKNTTSRIKMKLQNKIKTTY